MTSETLSFLWTWTPFLLQGLLWNIVIALCAVTLGSLLGAGLAWLRINGQHRAAAAAERVTLVLRGVPTLALIFYAVFVLPAEFTLPGSDFVLRVPQWIKAVIGLSAAPLAFTSESLVVAHRAWQRGDTGAALLFIPTWINVFLISFLASSATSLVGVSELVSRCNMLIAATGTAVMVPVYLYGSVYFVATSLLFTALIGRFKQSAWMARLALKLAHRSRP